MISKTFPGLLVIAAVTFNALLAAANANIIGMSSMHVIIAEVIILTLAHAYALKHYRSEMLAWYILAAGLVLIGLLRSVMMQNIDAKSMRDVVIIPTFVILGLVASKRIIVLVVLILQCIIVAVLLLEALATDVYSRVFKVMDYYISTRGNNAADFWNTDSDLYVSATRPDERIFSFIDLHRMSSVFLEPVSLGNYFLIVTIFICAFYHLLSKRVKIFLVSSNILILFGSDGRLALAGGLLICLSSFAARRLGSAFAVLYLPLTITAAVVLVSVNDLHPGGDDFPGRIAHTVDLLSRFDVADVLGINERFMSLAVDSGLAYLIITQSVVGLCCVWMSITLGAGGKTEQQKIFAHGAAIYVSLNCMVSFAFLTVKTGALLWFIFGFLQSPQHSTSPRK